MFSKTITGFPVANRTWNTSGFQNNHWLIDLENLLVSTLKIA
jgi:hypothetical protein